MGEGLKAQQKRTAYWAILTDEKLYFKPEKVECDELMLPIKNLVLFSLSTCVNI